MVLEILDYLRNSLQGVSMTRTRSTRQNDERFQRSCHSGMLLNKEKIELRVSKRMTWSSRNMAWEDSPIF